MADGNSVYLIGIDDPDTKAKIRTYIGATNNPHQRWRQHRGNLAKKTTSTFNTRMSVQKRYPDNNWLPILAVSGFPTLSHALKFEYASKHKYKSLARILKQCAKEAGEGDRIAAVTLSKLKCHPRVKILAGMLSLKDWKHLRLRVSLYGPNALPKKTVPACCGGVVSNIDYPDFTRTLKAQGLETGPDLSDQDSE